MTRGKGSPWQSTHMIVSCGEMVVMIPPFGNGSVGVFFITNINHGGRQPRLQRVGARYGQPVAQKIATGLL